MLGTTPHNVGAIDSHTRWQATMNWNAKEETSKLEAIWKDHCRKEGKIYRVEDIKFEPKLQAMSLVAEKPNRVSPTKHSTSHISPKKEVRSPKPKHEYINSPTSSALDHEIVSTGRSRRQKKSPGKTILTQRTSSTEFSRRFHDNLKTISAVPKDKYKQPLTTSQEVGWDLDLERVPENRFFRRGHNPCEETDYVCNFLRGECKIDPFAKDPFKQKAS